MPKRITVEPGAYEPSKNGHEQVAEHHGAFDDTSFGGQMQPAIFGPVDGRVVVPSSEQFALMRAEAKAAGTLKDLRKLAAAWQAVAEKCDLAFEELFKFAVFRLEVERDLGTQLAQTVKRGGYRPNYPRGSLLPDGVTWKQSAAYQKLAAIPEELFRGYVKKSYDAGRTPSSGAARAFAGAHSSKARRAPRSKKARVGDVVLSPMLIEACVRCLGDIDVLVGKVKVKAASCFADIGDLTETTQGKMLVVGACDPTESLRRVLEIREKGRIKEAIVALPRDIDAAWWSSLGTGPWSLCLPNERGSPIVAHIGGHARGFALVFAPLGVVAEVVHRLCDGARE